MVEVDYHCCIPNDCGDLPSQNIDMLVHLTYSGTHSPDITACDLWTASFSSSHHLGFPCRLDNPMQAAHGGV